MKYKHNFDQNEWIGIHSIMKPIITLHYVTNLIINQTSIFINYINHLIPEIWIKS